MIKKIVFLNLILFFIIMNKSNAYLESSIVIKIDNEIITNFEIQNKILSELIITNREINQENIDNLKKKTVESLIMLKLKKIELSKYNFKVNDVQLMQYLNSISSNDINSLKKKFEINNLDYNLFLNDIKTQIKWQQFIFSTYANKIEIDPLQIENDLENLIKSSGNLLEYNLSEIEIFVDENEKMNDKIYDIEQKINKIGFDQAAFNYSESPSASNKGSIGWINSKSLSRNIFEILNKMSIGEISEPIIKKNNILFLKINDKKIKQLDDSSKLKLKNDILNQKKNDLFNLYSKSHISKIKNNSLIEYK